MPSPANARDEEADTSDLGDLLKRELISVPLANWGHFFPCHVAAWRFLAARRPDLLGELSAGYDTEPWFRGRGSDWFVSVVGNDEGYLSAIEAIMYPLSRSLPPATIGRGFVRDFELPQIPSSQLRQFAQALARFVRT